MSQLRETHRKSILMIRSFTVLAVILIGFYGASFVAIASTGPHNRVSAPASHISWRITSDTLYITGKGSIPDYTNASPAPWHDRSFSKVVIGNHITAVGNRAFRNNTRITKVTLGSSVRRIGVKAFSFCMELKSINFPEGLKRIEEDAFEFCDDLERVDLPDSVTEVGDSAFYACCDMVELHLSAGLRSIGPSCFAFCTNLHHVTIPKRVRTIGSKAWASCYKLKNVTLAKEAGLERIGNQAFISTGLRKIRLPSHLKFLGKQALGYSEISGGEDDPVDPFAVKHFIIIGGGHVARRYARNNGFAWSKSV